MYTVHFKCGKLADAFTYNERENVSENLTIFKNTTTHKFIAIWKYQIIGYTAV